MTPTERFGTKAIITAIWRGDTDILFDGVEVDVLAYDRNTDEVPGRSACWIRYIWREGGAPMYRSCDISDLEFTDEQYAALATTPPREDSGEVARLRSVVERLGSMEAFTMSRAVDHKHDGELLARIDYARAALEPKAGDV